MNIKLLTIQSKFINFCFISERLKKIWKLHFSSKKLTHVKEKVCLRFQLFKNFSGGEQNQYMDALTAAKYKSRVDDSCLFNVSTPVRSQGQ